DPLKATGHTPHPELLAAAKQRSGGAMHQALLFYEEMLKSGHQLACVGGGDRHMVMMPGNPTTHVGVSGSDVQGVLAGIRACRTYVTAHPDGPEVELLADGDGDGVFEITMGGELTPGQPVNLLVRIRNTPGGRVDLRRTGVTVATVEDYVDPLELRFTDTPGPGDWYRVDYRERVDTAIPGGMTLLAVVTSKAVQKDFDWGSINTYATLLAAVATIPHIHVDHSFGTALPVIRVTREYSRILNAEPSDPQWSMAAITSPIFVGQ
ncbi:hypothetical protein ACFL59_12555, partial [Planctomycetota bacterium]